MSDPTPLPWVIARPRKHPHIKGPGGEFVMEHGYGPRTEADAALIVRAVNSHADLLAACEAARWALGVTDYDPERYDRAIELCDAAIAKAKGVTPC